MIYVCELLGISYPLIQGGMGNISNAQLTAAVSEAGGLGTIGCGTMTPKEVEQIILETKKLTEKRFAINIAINVSPFVEEMIELVIKHKIPIVSLSAGNPAPYIPILKPNGIIVMTVVASVKQALKAEQAGADIVVGEGFEAAGINSNLELTTFTLIPQLVKHVSIPIIAAGGIGDGNGLAAALSLGASGVQLGTRLVATKDAPFHELYKNRLIQASDLDTLLLGRSVGRIRRVLNTPYASRLIDREKQGMTIEDYLNSTTEEHHKKGALEGDLEGGFLNSGQIAGLLYDLPSVEELFNRMMVEAEQKLQNNLTEFRRLKKS
ncbi:nitronate monooxygenase [Psychrobacillus sp. MER TA 171]|uniref:NAD(P)H-dependent flavin oxidoreductase n=1 Tax=Psychrobacillus sp. MER TA 171 TaxID=2939577 RepID=UPI00203B7EB9|nr:nitronate monooxygenase [Psychrobacillus sp. MER TA 171]MCM3357196.1 nitronate monooxygenase [Psychrobacillus sp. MER TA 171]